MLRSVQCQWRIRGPCGSSNAPMCDSSWRRCRIEKFSFACRVNNTCCYAFSLVTLQYTVSFTFPSEPFSSCSLQPQKNETVSHVCVLAFIMCSLCVNKLWIHLNMYSQPLLTCFVTALLSRTPGDINRCQLWPHARSIKDEITTKLRHLIILIVFNFEFPI